MTEAAVQKEPEAAAQDAAQVARATLRVTGSLTHKALVELRDKPKSVERNPPPPPPANVKGVVIARVVTVTVAMTMRLTPAVTKSFTKIIDDS